MRIKSLTLKGYCGFSVASPLALEDLGHRNVLIGPNNAGKSTPHRFLEWVARSLDRDSSAITEFNKNQHSPHWWHESAPDQDIEATIELTELPETLASMHWDHGIRFTNESVARLNIRIQPYRESWQLCIAPALWNGREWLPTILPTDSGPNNPEFRVPEGYDKETGGTAAPWRNACHQLRELFARSIARIQAIRAIDYDLEDESLGSLNRNLLEKLHAWEQDPQRKHTWDRFERKIVRQLNELLDAGPTDRITGLRTAGQRIARNSPLGTQNPHTRLQLFLQYETGSLPLANLGSGVADAVVLLAALSDDESGVFLLDEPECHLHPGMLRRLMSMLGAMTAAQFLVATHSSVVLDSLGPDDRVFRVWREEGRSLVEAASSPLALHKVLDEVGITNSSLLQPNCILWVEGPSDRLYLRAWLEVAHPHWREGVDFAFLYYGGRLLSHFTLDSDEADGADDFIDMLRVCRFAFVLMDRDATPATPESELRATKLRILDEARADSDRRLAVVTASREIENYIPIEIARAAIAQALGVEPSVLSELEVLGTQPLHVEVASYLQERHVASSVAALKDKVSFARTVVATAARLQTRLPPPTFIESLAALIKRASCR